MATVNRIISSCNRTASRAALRTNRRSAVASLGAFANCAPLLSPRMSRTDCRSFSSSPSPTDLKSPFASYSPSSSSSQRRRPRRKLKFVPQKAAVALTPKARNFFRALLENTSDDQVVGIMLNYHQSSTGEPRMVFSFDFCKANQLTEMDEGCVRWYLCVVLFAWS